MTRTLLPPAALLIFCINFVTAQVIRVDTSKMGRGSNEVVIFSKDGASSPNGAAPILNQDNVVKIGLINFVSGNIPIYYERRILPFATVQVGLGITTRDFVADLVNIIIDNQNGNNPYYQYSERKPVVGIYASVQPKFYIHEDAPDGFWLSPMLEFKRYNFKANMIDENVSAVNGYPDYLPNTFFKERRDCVDFTVNLGWQWLLDNRVAVEFSMGGGFRRFWEQRLNIVSGTSQYSGYQTYINSPSNFNGWRPDFNLCLNLGGFF